MTDGDHASAIYLAAKKLNDAIKEAAAAGLRIEIFTREIQYIERRWPQPTVEAVVCQQVEIE